MSLILNIEELSNEERDKINNDMTIKIENKMSFIPPKIIYIPEILNDNIYLPFAYSLNILNKKRKLRKEFPEINSPFTGSLRDEQKIVKKEALEYLNKTGSVIISAYTGFGKCLGKNTPVLMYDGNIKMVQDIKVGEQIMGDDSSPRNILNICKGKEQMYKIIPNKGESFTCNESHILSLKISSHKSIHKLLIRGKNKFRTTYFNKKKNKLEYTEYFTYEEAEKNLKLLEDDNIIDISIRDYLKAPKSLTRLLKCYKTGVEFNNKINITLDPYILGLWLGNGTTLQTSIINTDKEIIEYLETSYCVANNLRLSKTEEDRICGLDKSYNSKTLFNKLKKYKLIDNKHIPFYFKCNTRYIRLKVLAGLLDSDGYLEENCYEIFQKVKILAEDILYLSRSLGFCAYIKETKNSCIYKGERREGTYYLVSIFGSGLEEIPVLLKRKKAHIINQVKDSLVNEFKVVPIEENDYYGFEIDGNRRFLLGDFTVTHNTILSTYLASTIKLKTLIIVNKIVLINQWKESIERFCPDATIQKVVTKSKLQDCDFYIMNAINVKKMGQSFFKDIGTVICDEVHLLMAESLSKSLHFISPRYLIGLSATPYRPDGLDILLELYFGKNKIVRKMNRKHIIFQVNTGFVPKVELTSNGKVNWGVILKSQSEDEKRNNLIIKIIKEFPKRNFLVLTKRVEQANILVYKLKEIHENVTSLIGKEQTFDKEARILVAISQKCSTGFDHPKMDTLILCSDVEQYFIQSLGRIFRKEESSPIVFDLLDKNPILLKHFKTRKEVYKENGGIVKDFFKEFPEFLN